MFSSTTSLKKVFRDNRIVVKYKFSYYSSNVLFHAFYGYLYGYSLLQLSLEFDTSAVATVDDWIKKKLIGTCCSEKITESSTKNEVSS